MKKVLLATLFFFSYFATSHAQFGFGAPPSGFFDMIIVFPPTVAAADIETLKRNMGANQLAITPVTRARLWRMRMPYASSDPSGVSYSYSDPTAAVKIIRGTTSGVGSAIQLNKATRIPEINFKIAGSKLLKPKLPITNSCKNDADYLMAAGDIGEGTAKVAILDSGLECNAKGTTVEYIHPILKKYVDAGDGLNANFTTEYGNNPNDGNGHGTAVASLVIRSFENAGKKNCRLIPVKVLDDRAQGTLFDLIQGIDYAILRGADIINISVVSPDGTIYPGPTPISKAMEQAQGKNILVISASGNGGMDIDFADSYVYPACATNDNQIVVGASNCSDSRTGFSNFGKTNVDIFAPGSGIYVYPTVRSGLTTTPFLDGTSFATPVATGVAAVLRTRQASRNWTQLKCALMLGAISNAAFVPYCVTGGVLNAPQTLVKFTNGSCK